MGRGAQKSKRKKKLNNGKNPHQQDGLWLSIDPACIRFQHSRIRPHFSGCGRSVKETLESIREGKLSPADLPPIQVIVGPEDESGLQWYFSLNNRRLWVLKRCREEGLLKNNVIPVRVRTPKSESERNRYTLNNCAVEARFLRETEQSRDAGSDRKDKSLPRDPRQPTASNKNAIEESSPDTMPCEKDQDDETSDSLSDDACAYTNPFNILL